MDKLAVVTVNGVPLAKASKAQIVEVMLYAGTLLFSHCTFHTSMRDPTGVDVVVFADSKERCDRAADALRDVGKNERN